jgi:hypothetical protein
MVDIQSYKKPLKTVFTDEDPELAPRVARLCVLFEDLRVEYWGSKEESLQRLDTLSTGYRRLYFLRRSLVTLDEFGGAINRLNAVKSWRQSIEEHGREEQRHIWESAIKFFGKSKDRFATIRNDIGGHYQERAAKYAVESMTPGTTGVFDIVVDGDGADSRLHFATELVGRLLVKDMPQDANPTDEQLQAYVGEIFETVTDGWHEVIKAVHVVAAAYLAPRFLKD